MPFITRLIDVDGSFQNNCGLFALALAVQLQLVSSEQNPSSRIPAWICREVSEKSVGPHVRDRNQLVTIAEKLRVLLAHAIETHPTYKKNCFISFCEVILNRVMGISSSDDMEAFVSRNASYICSLATDTKQLVIGERDLTGFIEPATERIAELYGRLLDVSRSDLAGFISKLLDSFYYDKTIPQLWYVCRLFQKSWELVTEEDLAEDMRRLVKETVNAWFYQQAFQYIEADLGDLSSCLGRLVECYQWLEGDKCDNPIDRAHSIYNLYIHYCVYSRWSQIFSGYLEAIRTDGLMLGMFELNCLARSWGVGLTIVYPDNSRQMVSEEGEAFDLFVVLKNRNNIHWMVEHTENSDVPSDSILSLSRYIEAAVEENARCEALRWGEQDLQSITYQDLNAQANQLAHYLQSLGLPQETRIGLYFPRSLRWVVSMLAVMKVPSLVFLPLPRDVPTDRLFYYIEDAQPDIILTDNQGVESALLAKYDDRIRILNIEELAPLLQQWSAENLSVEAAGGELAYVIYTSGSTGNPKGVMITHRGLPNCMLAAVDAMDLQRESRCLQFASMGFDASIMEVFAPLLVGATVCIFPSHDLAYLTPFCQRHKITAAILTASVLSQLQPDKLQDMRCVVSTGERLYHSTFERWSKALAKVSGRLLNGWGPTEATIGSTFGFCEIDAAQIHVGQAISDTKIYILDPATETAQVMDEVSHGQEGELYLSGIGLARGYWVRPKINEGDDEIIERVSKLNAQRFRVIDIRLQDGRVLKKVRVYQTKDRGCKQVEVNNVCITGRYDRSVKIHGEFVSPEEIEETIRDTGSQNISGAIVVPVLQDDRPPIFVATLYLKDPIGITLEILHQVLQKKLLPKMLPSRWIVADDNQLVYSSSNKIDIEKSLSTVLTSHIPIRFLSGMKRIDDTDSIAQEIKQIWQRSLGFAVAQAEISAVSTLSQQLADAEYIYPFHLDDRFDHLGGTSLQAMEMLEAVEKKFGERIRGRIDSTEFFHNPTIGSLVRAIHLKSQGNAVTPIRYLQPDNKEACLQRIGDKKTPLILIHSLFGSSRGDYSRLLEAAFAGDLRPIIGIDAIGLQYPELMGDSFPELAGYYIRELKKIYHGEVWLIGGWSGGGLIAIEMQRQLMLEGMKVYVTMFDTAAPTIYQDAGLQKEFDHFLGSLIWKKTLPDASPRERENYAKHSIANRLGFSEENALAQEMYRSFLAGVRQPNQRRLYYLIEDLKKILQQRYQADEVSLKKSLNLLVVIEAIFRSALSYQLPSFANQITLVAAEDSLERYGEEGRQLFWPSSWEIESIVVPGDHFFMIDPRILSKLNFAAMLRRQESQLSLLEFKQVILSQYLTLRLHEGLPYLDLRDDAEKICQWKDLCECMSKHNTLLEGTVSQDNKEIINVLLLYWAKKALFYEEFDVVIYLDLFELRNRDALSLSEMIFQAFHQIPRSKHEMYIHHLKILGKKLLFVIQNYDALGFPNPLLEEFSEARFLLSITQHPVNMPIFDEYTFRCEEISASGTNQMVEVFSSDPRMYGLSLRVNQLVDFHSSIRHYFYSLTRLYMLYSEYAKIFGGDTRIDSALYWRPLWTVILSEIMQIPKNLSPDYLGNTAKKFFIQIKIFVLLMIDQKKEIHAFLDNLIEGIEKKLAFIEEKSTVGLRLLEKLEDLINKLLLLADAFYQLEIFPSDYLSCSSLPLKIEVNSAYDYTEQDMNGIIKNLSRRWHLAPRCEYLLKKTYLDFFVFLLPSIESEALDQFFNISFNGPEQRHAGRKDIFDEIYLVAELENFALKILLPFRLQYVMHWAVLEVRIRREINRFTIEYQVHSSLLLKDASEEKSLQDHIERLDDILREKLTAYCEQEAVGVIRFEKMVQMPESKRLADGDKSATGPVAIDDIQRRVQDLSVKTVTDSHKLRSEQIEENFRGVLRPEKIRLLKITSDGTTSPERTIQILSDVDIDEVKARAKKLLTTSYSSLQLTWPIENTSDHFGLGDVASNFACFEKYVQINVLNSSVIPVTGEKRNAAFENRKVTSKKRQEYDAYYLTERLIFPANKLFLQQSSKADTTKIRSILITGNAGSGKSTACHSMLFQFAEANLWQEEFDWVFRINLAEIPSRFLEDTFDGNSEKLCKLIFASTELRKERWSEEARLFLWKNIERSKTLYIFDGFDELPGNTPVYRLIHELLETQDTERYFIITSRLYCVESLSPIIDLHVELVGLTDADIEKYVNKTINDSDKRQEFYHYLNMNLSVKQIARIPLLLRMILSSFLNSSCHKDKMRTMTQLFENIVFTLLYQALDRFRVDMKSTPSFLAIIRHPAIKYYLGFFKRLAYECCFFSEDASVIQHETLIEKLASYEESLEDDEQREFARGYSAFEEKLPFIGIIRRHTAEDGVYFYVFIHATLRDYLAAWFIADKLVSRGGEAESAWEEFEIRLKNIKYNPRYYYFLAMLAGFLYEKEKKSFDYPLLTRYFYLLHQKLRDLSGLNEACLMMRCFEQTMCFDSQNEFIQNTKEWIIEFILYAFSYSVLIEQLISCLNESPFFVEKTQLIDRLLDLYITISQLSNVQRENIIKNIAKTEYGDQVAQCILLRIQGGALRDYQKSLFVYLLSYIHIEKKELIESVGCILKAPTNKNMLVDKIVTLVAAIHFDMELPEEPKNIVAQLNGASLQSESIIFCLRQLCRFPQVLKQKAVFEKVLLYLQHEREEIRFSAVEVISTAYGYMPEVEDLLVKKLQENISLKMKRVILTRIAEKEMLSEKNIHNLIMVFKTIAMPHADDVKEGIILAIGYAKFSVIPTVRKMLEESLQNSSEALRNAALLAAIKLKFCSPLMVKILLNWLAYVQDFKELKPIESALRILSYAPSHSHLVDSVVGFFVNLDNSQSKLLNAALTCLQGFDLIENDHHVKLSEKCLGLLSAKSTDDELRGRVLKIIQIKKLLVSNELFLLLPRQEFVHHKIMIVETISKIVSRASVPNILETIIANHKNNDPKVVEKAIQSLKKFPLEEKNLELLWQLRRNAFVFDKAIADMLQKIMIKNPLLFCDYFFGPVASEAKKSYAYLLLLKADFNKIIHCILIRKDLATEKVLEILFRKASDAFIPMWVDERNLYVFFEGKEVVLSFDSTGVFTKEKVENAFHRAMKDRYNLYALQGWTQLLKQYDFFDNLFFLGIWNGVHIGFFAVQRGEKMLAFVQPKLAMNSTTEIEIRMGRVECQIQKGMMKTAVEYKATICDAIATYESIIEVEPSFYPAYLSLMHLYWNTGLYEKMNELHEKFKKQMRSLGGEATVQHLVFMQGYHAQYLGILNKSEQQREEWRVMLTYVDDGYVASIYFSMACEAEARGGYDEAIRHCEQGELTDNNHMGIKFLKAFMYSRQGDFETADKIVKKILENVEGQPFVDANFLNILGVIEFEKIVFQKGHYEGNYPAVLGYFNHALEFGLDPCVLANKAFLLLRQLFFSGVDTDAKREILLREIDKLVEDALMINPNRPYTLFVQLLFHMHRDHNANPQEVKKSFDEGIKKLLTQFCNSVDFLYYIAETYLAFAYADEARVHIEALSLIDAKKADILRENLANLLPILPIGVSSQSSVFSPPTFSNSAETGRYSPSYYM